MNKILSLLLTVVTLSAVAFNAAAAKKYIFVAMDNSLATKTCVAAGNDNKRQLKQHIRKFTIQAGNGKPVRQIANSLYCNNMFVASFAKKYNAFNTHSYLNRYTKAKNRDKTHTYIKDITAHNNQPDEIVYINVASNN
jgi:hypothetical protein